MNDSDAVVDWVEDLEALQNKFLNSINCFLEISKQSIAMVYILENVLEKLHDVEKSISEIEKINHKTKYLALNATIESVRDENSNKSFQAVANEIRELSNDTHRITINVRQQVSTINSSLDKAQAILKNIVEIDSNEHILLKESLDQILHRIVHNKLQIQESTINETFINLEKIQHDL